MGCEPLIFYYISSSSIEQKISKIVPLQESKKEVVVPNKKLESKKWAKFIVGSMHYYGDGREKDKKKAEFYLRSFLNESNPEGYNWQYLEAKRMLMNNHNNISREYQIESKDGSIKIFIGKSNVQYEDDIYGVVFPLEIIEINTPSSITVFNNLEFIDNIHYDEFRGIGWADNDNFIIHATTSTYTNTFILNVRTMNFKLISNGAGYIVNLPNIGRALKLNTQKRYFQSMYNPPRDIMGAFWIDAIYDFEGNLLKILSYEPDMSDGTCYLVKDLIDIKKYQFLIQSPNECIYVYR